MNPKYPVFIPSKGRADSRLTVKALEAIDVPFTVFVEPQEFDPYSRVIDSARLHILPHRDCGLVVTRNYIWDYAQRLGTPYFWTIDDNIRGFYRFNHNLKVPVADGTIFRVAEEFTERYLNVAISGMHYFMFAPRKAKLPPFEVNTRVYSNMLIKTAIPYRNRGFYNDDTDLCLRVLKDGWCTILFFAFLAEKSVTMTVRGGLTPSYQGKGRLRMAQELQARHPDVTKIVRKWGRWQHQVDYRPFKRNKLIRKPGLVIPDRVNEYGMKLVTKAG